MALSLDELQARIRQGPSFTDEVNAPELRGEEDEEVPTVAIRPLTKGEVGRVSSTAMKGYKLNLDKVGSAAPESVEEAMNSGAVGMDMDLESMVSSSSRAEALTVACGLSVEKDVKVDQAEKLPPKLFNRILEKVVALTDDGNLREAVGSFRVQRRGPAARGGSVDGESAERDGGTDDSDSG